MSELQTFLVFMGLVMGTMFVVFSPLMYRQWKTQRECRSRDEVVSDARASGPNEMMEEMIEHKLEMFERKDKTVFAMTTREVLTFLGMDYREGGIYVDDVDHEYGDLYATVWFSVSYTAPDPLLGIAKERRSGVYHERVPLHEFDELLDAEVIGIEWNGGTLKIGTLDMYEEKETQIQEDVVQIETYERVIDKERRKFRIEPQRRREYVGEPEFGEVHEGFPQ